MNTKADLLMVGHSRLKAARRRLQTLFVPHLLAQNLNHRQHLVSLELRWKLEELLLLPCLDQAGVRAADMAPVDLLEELQPLRDLAALADPGSPPSGQELLRVLETLTASHFTRVCRSLDAAPNTAVDWCALESEIRALLARWMDESKDKGDIEDEETDPVGAPPR